MSVWCLAQCNWPFVYRPLRLNHSFSTCFKSWKKSYYPRDLLGICDISSVNIFSATSSFALFFFDRMLKKYIHLVLAERSKVRFFLPLCGKTVDMKWYETDLHVRKDIHRQFFTFLQLGLKLGSDQTLFFCSLLLSQASGHGSLSGRCGDLRKSY